MKLLSVTTPNEAGEHKLDPNKIVELLIRIVAVVGAIVALRASKQSGQNKEKIATQQHFLNVDRGSEYVAEVEKSANQRRK
jgi:hypothetical protein